MTGFIKIIYDVLVVGGGHAGSEAALVAARLGAKTALVTLKRDSIGEMSCNPAIGGLGKGQLVKEVDALYGEMALAIDDSGIQFRTLNASKGPAVRSSRVQADRMFYRQRIQQAVNSCPGLVVIEAAAGSLEFRGKSICGIRTESGEFISAKTVVLTTGTFLSGLMHTGQKKTPGGRLGEKASYKLSLSLASLGLTMGRLKTGTPPRLSAKSLDFSRLIEQPGDTPIRPFSFRTAPSRNVAQISCWITSTNPKTHEIIASDIDRAPLFNGQIDSTGPRYCPSIEDKVHRFSDKHSHNIFLEPEGFNTDIVYPNGISTSLPADTQKAFVRSIKGLERAKILQYGYAIEYDFVDPRALNASLAVRGFEGLFFAGQINGTTGYEEAAAQGLIAGINAYRYSAEQEPLTLRRDQAYIGVMIDDLISRGAEEPYRMFTSRAEYRLHLREDNADSRLTPIARELGLVADDLWTEFVAREARIAAEKKRFCNTYAKPAEETNAWLVSLGSAEIYDGTSLATLIRRPELSYRDISKRYYVEDPEAGPFGLEAGPSGLLDSREGERLETELKFAGYLKRQEAEIDRMKKMEQQRIPEDFSFIELPGLRRELQQRLSEVRPETLGQAARIYGVTPAAVSLIAVYLRRKGSVEKRDTRPRP